MRLLDLYIENFGKLSDFSLKFTGSLNTIEKENGYGKTTLTVFIKSMLYGLDDTKSTRLEKNSRKRYMPWQGGRFGGSLSFEAGGKKYRIERFFGKRASEDSFKLYDLSSGKESFDFTSDIGEELFGIDADGFERTIFLSEANLSGKNENKTVSAKLSNLVGYDGDLSDMDGAIELLNKRRQIYYKLGGAGEIGEVKKQISRLDCEINDLIRLGDALTSEEEKIKAFSIKTEELLSEKALLTEKAKQFAELKIKQAFIDEYTNMKNALEKDKKALSELEAFFRNGVPTAEEIEDARENTAKAKTLSEKENIITSTELDTLSAFFSEEVSNGEFEGAKALLSKIEAQESKCERTKFRMESIRPTLARSLPEPEEISAHIDAVTKAKEQNTVNKGGHTLLFLSFALVLAGLAFGILLTPIMFLLMLTALPPFYISIKQDKNGKKVNTGITAEESARLFIAEQDSSLFDSGASLLEKLYTLRSLAKARHEKEEELQSLLVQYGTENKELSAYINEAEKFVFRFQPTTEEACVRDMKTILHKRELYLALLSTKTAEIKQREETLILAREMQLRTNAFLSRFPTASERPLDEISSKLIEYSALLHSTELARARVEDFRREHGISDELPKLDEAGERENAEKLSAVEESITELQKEKALAERQFNILYEKVSGIDDLLSEKEALSEKEESYRRELDTILMTRDFLVEAKDNLTSKYLSKTKSAFDKYIGVISKFSTDDFIMDTSFAVMKKEHGSLKSADAYSRGERDLFALAARLALIDSLYENETPFIILDDPFAYFDDTRLSSALAVIKDVSKEKQIIYLTCTDARKA